MAAKRKGRPFWVRNPGREIVLVVHESGSGETLAVGPGETVLVGRPEVWAESYNLERAVAAGLLERGDGPPPPGLPPLPEDLSRGLSAHQLHTVRQIVLGPEALALQVINVTPQPEVAEDRDGLDARSRRILIERHLPVLEAALWLEGRRPGGPRPQILTALQARVEQIRRIAFAEVRLGPPDSVTVT